MSNARDRLLSRYLEAANAMANVAPSAATGDRSSLRASQAWASKEHVRVVIALNDTAAAATQKLLERQAVLLTRIHTSINGDQEAAGAHGVDVELLRQRLQDITSIATSKLYAYRFDRVPAFWRCLYTDALVLTTHHHILQALSGDDGFPDDRSLDSIVENLDRALITTGGASNSLPTSWIEDTLRVLEDFWLARKQQDMRAEADQESGISSERAPKRQRRDEKDENSAKEAPADTFPTHEPYRRPQTIADKECPRHSGWTLDRFEEYMNRDGGNAWPVVFTDLIDEWPALTDRPWRRPEYLLSQTFGGRRLVPVEVGRSYVDDGWGQELIPFGQFLTKYVSIGFNVGDQDAEGPGNGPRHRQAMGYLAQHNLFHQIPRLRNDTTIPDFCWAAVPPHPLDPSRDRPRLDAPQLNAWFGPAGTITPLHTDGYHNLLCQVVGTKYVRLYPPHAGSCLRPRGQEGGVDMSNTSALDLGVLEGWDEPGPGHAGPDDDAQLAEARDRLRQVEYRECVLGPGDTLLIPIGWWHYVRSLSVSFSISFWWN
ncbi:hypothetical protein HIM_00507 [Hirsutella minnesotensis 3608]|nr:hypothetical protein HIM_00507 [Hirsutella minnesotensis 3608]